MRSTNIGHKINFKTVTVGWAHRLEKREDSFEKNEVRDEGPKPDESAPAIPPPAAPPYVAAWFLGRF